jgi:sirohydrochlorin cobaltochelatase
MANEPFDAVVLIAHGARDARWMEPFHALRRLLADRLAPKKVALAFMEFAAPTLADATDEVHRAGARRILVAPLFLSGGGHVAKDIPDLVEAERRRHPDAFFAIAGAIGEEPEVAAGMLEALTRLVTDAG